MSAPETRFMILTNDAIILSLADFPYHISKWGIDSTSLQDLVRTDERETWILRTTIKEQLKTLNPDKENPLYLTIHDRISELPQDYQPKITWLECVTPDGDYLKFKRETIKTKNIADKGFHSEILYYMDKIWGAAQHYYRKTKGFTLKHKMPSCLLLEKINGSEKDAKNQNLCFDINDQIIKGGNILAKIPICISVYRSQVKRNVYEYQVIPRQEVPA